MKQTNLYLCFLLYFVVTLVRPWLQEKTVTASSYSNTENNRIVDKALEDALFEATEMGENGKIIIDDEKAKSFFYHNLCEGFDCMPDSEAGLRLKEAMVVLAVIHEHCFSVILKDEIRIIDYIGEGQLRDKLVEEFENAVREDNRYFGNYRFFFPSIEKEEGYQNITANSMLCFLVEHPLSVEDFSCRRFVLSGASIRKQSHT